MNIKLAVIVLTVIISYIIWRVFDRVIFPIMVHYGMKEIERNPKWITSQLRPYYGFDSIDFVLCESKWGMLPRFRAGKTPPKVELWISNDTTTDEVEDLGRLALAAKIKTIYGLWYPDKPLPWLSALCFMLDGGTVDYQIRVNNKPLD